MCVEVDSDGTRFTISICCEACGVEISDVVIAGEACMKEISGGVSYDVHIFQEVAGSIEKCISKWKMLMKKGE